MALMLARGLGEARRPTDAECGTWAAPWYCYTPAGWVMDQCREHDSLVRACKEGWYGTPPPPPAPKPPTGGSQGAVTDPDAVDEVVTESAEAYRQRVLEWARAQASNLPPAEQEKPLSTWVYVLALGTVAILVIALKR